MLCRQSFLYPHQVITVISTFLHLLYQNVMITIKWFTIEIILTFSHLVLILQKKLHTLIKTENPVTQNIGKIISFAFTL